MLDTDPKEVHAIVGKLLELIGEHVSCSDEIVVAALKVAAMTVEETKSAQFGAKLRAEMFMQYRAKR
jgi:hypothetical protein